ncbi:MAG: hypothetical protein EKK62_04085 [Acidimicrobiia bacterium]|nr:MAG: hypothetical protein EKK62_04085 [Acidimicrobiia bacterium]
MSTAARVREYQAAHPEARPADVARALGIPSSRYFDAFRRYSKGEESRGHHPGAKRLEWNKRVAKLLPMLPGAGERRDDCQRYSECLSRVVKVGGEAHCPVECASYEATPREYYRASAMAMGSGDSGYAVHLIKNR